MSFGYSHYRYRTEKLINKFIYGDNLNTNIVGTRIHA